MDDLLVVILSLIIAGAGALGQLKKKKQVPQGSSGATKTPEDIWKLFNVDLGMNQYEEEPYEAKEVFVKEPGPAVNEQNYSFNPNSEGGKVFESTVSKSALISKKKSVFKSNFSLRDAVIYNEILNRKYF